MASLLLSSRLRHSDSESDEEGSAACRLGLPGPRSSIDVSPRGTTVAKSAEDSCEEGEIGDDLMEVGDDLTAPPAKRARVNNVWKNSLIDRELEESITAFGVEKNLTEELYVEKLSQNKLTKRTSEQGALSAELRALDDDLEAYKGAADVEDATYDADAAECKFASKLVPLVNSNNGDKECSRGRKRKFGPSSVCRNGGLKSNESTAIEIVSLDPSASVLEIGKQIAGSIKEPKKEMFNCLIELIGVQHAIKLYNRAIDIEQNGGMLTHGGGRRRTPGGVFIQLCRDDPGPKTTLAALESVINTDRKQNRLKGKRGGRNKERKNRASDPSYPKVDDFELELERTRARVLELKKVREVGANLPSSCSMSKSVDDVNVTVVNGVCVDLGIGNAELSPETPQIANGLASQVCDQPSPKSADRADLAPAPSQSSLNDNSGDLGDEPRVNIMDLDG